MKVDDIVVLNRMLSEIRSEMYDTLKKDAQGTKLFDKIERWANALDTIHRFIRKLDVEIKYAPSR